MVSCRIVEFFYDAVPSRRFRDFLIRRHMDRCPSCQARLVSQGEAQLLFVRTEAAARADDLWRRVEGRAGSWTLAPEKLTLPESRPAALRLSWEWAAGAAMLLLTAAASFWLLRGIQTASLHIDSVRPADRFEINYINVGGSPAQAYIYRPQGSDMIVVWAEKNP